MKPNEKPDHRTSAQIKQEAERWLFEIPGVRGVALGPKFVADRAIGKLAIQVFVESKRSRVALDAGEVIPEFIEGIPTDVWEWRRSVDTQHDITVDDCPTGLIEQATAISSGSTVTHLEIHSTAHGLFDNARVHITGANAGINTHLSYPVVIVNDDTFRIPVQENGQDMTPVVLPYVANSARWINACTLENLCCCPTGEITFIGILDDKISIGSPRHGLLSGDRIKIRRAPLLLRPPIHVVKRIDADNFELVGSDPAEFAGGPNGWRWRKVSLAPTGRITRIQMTNPIVLDSAAHGLEKGDRIVIQTVRDVTVAHLDNHINRAIGPYRVEIVDADRFRLPGVDATGWGSPNLQDDFLGSWIKVVEDLRKYGRKWGGIRIEMKESETQTVQGTPASSASSPLTTSIRPGGTAVRVRVELGTGTLGCLAIDDATGKPVLLSNAHVLFSGTDNDEVHHPDYYVSSRTCSKHKIAVRLRQVHGEDPAQAGRTVDAAIARFEPDDRAYDPFIADIGPIEDTAQISDADLVNGDYRVWKRGAQTGITEGIVVSRDFTFHDQETNIQWRNQLRIRPMHGEFRGFMTVHGDSGSVLVNDQNRVVGLLSKALSGGAATANPIRDVELALGIKIWNIHDAVAAGDEPVEPGKGQTATVGIPDLLAGTLAELSASETGNHLAVVVRSHLDEAIQLMEMNKKFATLWHRNHGPELMQHLREAIERRNQRMPSSIEGRSLHELVTAILDALRKFGSAELVAHVNEHEQLVLHLLNCTYEEMLQFLKGNARLAFKV
ncbi:MAG: serine protease [Nitrospirales bacterium]|nr:serine protease [Nitrospirales bacterium]